MRDSYKRDPKKKVNGKWLTLFSVFGIDSIEEVISITLAMFISIAIGSLSTSSIKSIKIMNLGTSWLI